ncbi:MAG: efflux RND transporter periplasmic adaptor subunit [Bryobacterales bacterium]|nr:efflux RND transporter periplasmic adaptor subunit [Bryobacterales bacterium]
MQRHRNNGRSRLHWFWTALAAVLVVGCLGIGLKAALRRHHHVDPSKLARVERGDLARVVVAVGKIEPKARVEVRSKASGIVKQVLVH